jgi:ABC-2 type transport system permease protein
LSDFALSPRRIGAIVLRHLYVLRGSWPRLIELIYWPIMQVIIWGTLSTFFATNSTWIGQAFGVLLGAVMLWDVLFRGQLGFTLSFLEEMWSRNLGNLYVTPLRPYEHLAGLMTMSLVRTLIGVLPASLLTIPLYRYSIFELGLPLIAFFTNLMVMGWATGMVVTALIMRYGVAAENLAWFLVFMLAPVVAVYYPVTVLPGWLQTISWMLPATYVFEGMRALMLEGAFRADLLAGAVVLNLAYIALGCALFLYAFRVARRRGLLLNVGE